WQRAVRKEVRIVCSWGSLAIGLFIWERGKPFGFAARRTEIWFLLCLWLSTVSLGYGTLWWWKRKKRKRENEGRRAFYGSNNVPPTRRNPVGDTASVSARKQ